MTETALAIKEDMTLTVNDVKKYIAPNATDKELFMFMGISKSFGLNPFKREVHFIKYGNNAASIVVGYEQYLKRAERTGKLDGWKCWIEDMGKPTERAVIEIRRKDQSQPIVWEVYRKEFDKQQSTWKTMGSFMLKKVAISQGFRLAFPDDLGGMPYIPEELPQTTEKVTSEALNKDVIDVEETPKDDIPENLGTELINDCHKLTLQQIIDEKNIDTAPFFNLMKVTSLEMIPIDDYEKALDLLKRAKGRKK